MIVEPLTYAEALRSMFYADEICRLTSEPLCWAPLSAEPEPRIGVLYVYRPGHGYYDDEAVRALPDGRPATPLSQRWPDMLDGCLVKAETIWPRDRSFIVGAAVVEWRNGAADVVRYPLDWHIARQELAQWSDRIWPATEAGLAVSERGNTTWITSDVEARVRDLVTASARRVETLRKVWQGDIRDDGPHQPWARARGQVMLGLLDLGVLPAALQLLPQWERQWWYDAVGYDQESPKVAPRPTRCWHFPRRIDTLDQHLARFGALGDAHADIGVCGNRLGTITECEQGEACPALAHRPEPRPMPELPLPAPSDGVVDQALEGDVVATARARPPQLAALPSLLSSRELLALQGFNSDNADILAAAAAAPAPVSATAIVAVARTVQAAGVELDRVARRFASAATSQQAAQATLELHAAALVYAAAYLDLLKE